MAFVQDLQAAVVWIGWYILPFVFVMTAIVFFHELGHYLGLDEDDLFDRGLD